jgi:hypothetical protein
MITQAQHDALDFAFGKLEDAIAAAHFATSYKAEDLRMYEPAWGLSWMAQAQVFLEQTLILYVRAWRSEGATWQEIAQALGVTRQAAWEKYSKLV